MKCPKCGYNSFEFLDTCKKCKIDLSAFKETHGIRSIVTPLAAAAGAITAVAAAVPAITTAAAAPEETFTWEASAPAATPAQPQIKPGDDIFPTMDFGFAPPPATGPGPGNAPLSFDLEPTIAAAPAAPPAVGEADLDDFSFDESPPETPADPPALFGSAPADDDGFASLLETGDSSEETAAAPAPAPTPELESPWEAPANTFGGFDEEQNGAPVAADGLDLESFSWGEEETKEPAPPAKGPQVELEGFSPTEFDSLFGEPETK